MKAQEHESTWTNTSKERVRSNFCFNVFKFSCFHERGFTMMDLAKVIYLVSKFLPAEEKFGLSSQIQRAAVGIPSNIAEGWRRKSSKEYSQFLHIAFGSAAELETQLLLISDLYPEANTSKGLQLVEEIQKMLNVLIRKIGA